MTTMLDDPSAQTITAFAFDPVASHSAQFPLARPLANSESSEGERDGVLPWGLRGLRPGPDPMDGVPNWHYDHTRQVALDDQDEPLHEIHMATTSTSLDGSGGKSEDWSAKDFMPDVPFPSVSRGAGQR